MTLGNDNGTYGQTDRQTDRVRRRREEGRIISCFCLIIFRGDLGWLWPPWPLHGYAHAYCIRPGGVVGGPIVQLRTCNPNSRGFGAILGKLFYPCASVSEEYNLVPDQTAVILCDREEIGRAHV